MSLFFLTVPIAHIQFGTVLILNTFFGTIISILCGFGTGWGSLTKKIKPQSFARQAEIIPLGQKPQLRNPICLVTMTILAMISCQYDYNY